MFDNFQNEPAFVNLALIGGSGDQYTESLKMGESLIKFRYDLLTEKGKNSYTYTIELLNANESLTSALLSLYYSDISQIDSVNILAQSLNGSNSLATVNSTLFPKLLVQWGYDEPNRTTTVTTGAGNSVTESSVNKSRIHLAQISNIEYKFSQQNEKILIITAVDVSESSRIHTSNIAETPKVRTPINITYGYKRIKGTRHAYAKHHLNFSKPDLTDASYTSIILEQIANLMRMIPGLTPVVLEVPKEDDSYMSELIDGIYSRAFENINLKNSVAKNSNNNVVRDTREVVIEMGEEVKSQFNDGESPGNLAEWYASARKLTEYIGCKMVNLIPGDTPDRLFSITKEHMLKDGTHGYSTDVLAPDQLTKDADLTKIHAAAEPIVMGPLTPVFRYGEGFGSNGVLAIDSLILSAVDKFMGLNDNPELQAELILNSELRLPIRSENMDRLWWEDTPSQPIKSYMFLATSPAGEHASLAITLEDGRVFQTYRGKELSDILRSVMESFRDAGQYFDNEPVTDQRLLFPSLYIHVNYYPFRGVSPPNAQITHWCEDLLHLKEKAKEELFDEGLKDVFTQAYIDENDLTNLDESSFGFEREYDSLSPSEKEDLHHSYIHTYTESPKGETLMDTALGIIKKYNSLVVKSSDKIGIVYTTQSYLGDFKDRVADFKDGKISSATDICYIGKLPALKSGAGSTMRNMPGEQPGTLMLKYGKDSGSVDSNNSNIVKYFDFKSDNRYLGNLMTSILTLKTLKQYSQLLASKSIQQNFINWKRTLEHIFEIYNRNEDMHTDITNGAGVDIHNVLREAKNTGDLNFTQNQYGSFEVMRDLMDELVISGDLDLGNNQYATGSGSPTAEEFSNLYIFLQAVSSPIMMGVLFMEHPDAPHDVIYDTSKREFIIDNIYGSVPNQEMIDFTAKYINYFPGNSLASPGQLEYQPIAPVIPSYDFDGSIKGKDIIKEAYSYIMQEPDKVKNYGDQLIYTLKNNNAFDDALDSTLSDELALQMQFFMKNIQQVYEIRVKTLGIPFTDTHMEMTAPRIIKFEVEDLTPSNNDKNLIPEFRSGKHWLTGAYRSTAISHEIDVNGYTTEFRLQKSYGRTTY